jgi:hypothetical protein
MKTPNAGWLVACGALLGFSLALCLGAATRTNLPASGPAVAAAADTPKSPWARLKVVTYRNGSTGFFDEDTGIMYVYDGDLRNCYLIRQLRVLGDPMERP